MSSPETIPGYSEKIIDSTELESIRRERREKLRDNLEKEQNTHNHQKQNHDAIEAEARRDAYEKSRSVADTLAPSRESSPARKRGLITKHHRELSFTRQMTDIQQTMNSREKRFSKVIHNKSIEKISDSLGSTIARPNALLTGSITAFVTVTIVYLCAKHYGYHLSGFETIGSFIIGWVFGLLYDYIRVLMSGKR